ncbi:ribonuclease D [Desulforhopalus singaporensis]|uniref:Ribonuclease D n=1 Tax=Desulforhopalus singaporensis TaxID=91360 RepID=A0A1H0MLW7_9BACT|nr:ribonuclease D [Desulforhopalus singaporensis]SDO81140.1 ribonuclease D [Desulforhopalus singaporensis]
MERPDTIITDKNDLQLLMDQAHKVDAVAMDTEFVWERTYYPQLGLIQIALSDEQCYIIDPLAIKDLTPLGELLSNRSVIKIFHDAPQDLAILEQATGAVPQNIFDTRLAAGFCNLPATLSLCKLIKELLDITILKDETRTNWLKRPLTENQIRYALDDVRYLRATRVVLLNRIIGPKIRSWLQEELNNLNNPANYNGTSTTDRYRKLRGSNNLNAQELAIAKNLTIWREGVARKNNRPRGFIVKDTLLVEIARSKPTSVQELAEKTSISARAVKQFGEVVTAIVDTTLAQDNSTYPQPKRAIRLSKSDKESLERLNNLIDLKCQLLGIAPSLLGNSNELKRLIKTLRGKKSFEFKQLKQTAGWRKNFLEDFFRQNQ